MSEQAKIKHLVRLLDDESAEIRERVISELLDCGGDTELRIRQAVKDLSPDPQAMRELLFALRARELQAHWADWFLLPEGPAKLERAYEQLSRLVHLRWEPPRIGKLLDDWADHYIRTFSYASVFQLARFLFEDGNLRPAVDNFYTPKGSDLGQVLEGAPGIPITLVAAYQLIGRRLGLQIRGCAFPGRFLAVTQVDQVTYVVDCYSGGRFIPADSFVKAQQDATQLMAEEFVQNPPDTEMTMLRVLNNLMRAYNGEDQARNCAFIADLASELELHAKRRQVPESKPPVFRPGQLVRHTRYGYRGVIVDYDLRCTAPEDWYQSNRTQPDREQPWYHVLVDSSDQTTYAAETSLQRDRSDEAIRHPLLGHFFVRFHNRLYLRNGRPWGG